MIDYNKLSQTAHEAALKNGWYEGEQAFKAFAADFKSEIKDTFEDEIADTVIRICDFCGWYGIQLGEVKKLQTKSKGRFDSDLVYLDKIITSTYDLTDKEKIGMSFVYLLGAIESIAEVYGFDLEQHINLKLAYNATRGYKHGNKVL